MDKKDLTYFKEFFEQNLTQDLVEQEKLDQISNSLV